METLSDRPALATVVAQHVEESAWLRNLRSTVVRSAGGGLRALGRLDDRLAAHLDGIPASRQSATRSAGRGDAPRDKGVVFVDVIGMLKRGRVDDVVDLADGCGPDPVLRRGLSSALGWVSPGNLKGVIGVLMATSDDTRRSALAACGSHGIDPGRALDRCLDGEDGALRTEALRTAIRCGRTSIVNRCLEIVGTGRTSLAFETARTACLLGDRETSSTVLAAIGLDADSPAPARRQALRLAAFTATLTTSRSVLRRLAERRDEIRLLLAAVGDAGDVHYVPWLVDRMQDPALARLAGESFTAITGIALAQNGLDGPRPVDAVPLVDDDPAHDRVAMDEDDGLPWPDAARVADWWRAHRSDFPDGVRLWMGRPPSVEHGVSVLVSGTQRQRAIAAERLCLLRPGTPLFNVAAPAWRQQRLLADMHR